MKKQVKIRRSKRNPAQVLEYAMLEPRQLLAGDVSVTLRNGNLTILGDDHDNSITLRYSDDDQVLISGNNTLINGTSQPLAVPARLRNVSIHLRNGDNWLEVSGLSLRGNLTVRSASGDNSIFFQNLFARQFSVNTGTGNDTLSLENLNARRGLALIASGGDNVVALQEIQTRRHLSVRLGAGNDLVATEKLQVNRDARFQANGGDNQFLFNGNTFVSRRLDIQTGNGQDNISLVPQRVGESLVARRLNIRTGGGDDQVFLDENCLFRQRVVLKGQNGANRLQVESQLPRRVITRSFITDSDIPINQMVHDCWEVLSERGLDAEPFGEIRLIVDFETQFVTVNSRIPSLSSRWDDAAQQAVLSDRSGPTIASRVYGMVHTAIFNAWAVYDPSATPTLKADLQRPASEHTHPNKTTAMSFAAHRVLSDLFPNRTTLFDQLMEELSLDRFDTGLDPTTPSGIGHLMAQALLEQRHQDGSNQLGIAPNGAPNGTTGVPYSDTSGYQPVNSVDGLVDISRWTPERFPLDVPEGVPQQTQSYLTPHWGTVQPFGDIDWSSIRPEPPEPFLSVPGSVDYFDRTITTAEGTFPISRELIGSVINPSFIRQAEEVIEVSANLTDEQKVIAEFWEDGPGTSFPPGTWMTFGQFVSARNNHSIDQDAKMFFALGNAVMNAGIGAWEVKGHFDYARPVRAIRNLAELGLVGEFNDELGGYAIQAWVPNQGTQMILGSQFTPYQLIGGHPSPPFAEFTSGHSTFSAAAAEVLRSFTLSDTFHARVRFEPGLSLFEPGITPTEAIELSWPTFSAAANQAGMSRLYGGIHFIDGNVSGLTQGAEIGRLTWQTALNHFGG